MKYFFFLCLYIISFASWGCGEPAKDLDCEMNSMEVFLPEKMRYPVENVRLEHFQYATEHGSVDLKVDSDDLRSLRESVNTIAGKVFQNSKLDYQILIRFTLSKQAAPKIDMKISDVDKDEPSLRIFYDGVSELKTFRSIKDKVYVVLHYKIQKAKSKSGKQERVEHQ